MIRKKERNGKENRTLCYNKKLWQWDDIPLMSRIFIEEANFEWLVFSNGVGGEEKSLAGSICGHSTQGITWLYPPTIITFWCS